MPGEVNIAQEVILLGNKILIVEDDLNDLEVLKDKLKSYELITAANGKDGLELLERENPDLVILDILIPDIDGFEICRRIRKSQPYGNLPVLFHTNVNTIDDRLLGLEMGASDFLNKSADERELLVRVKNLLSAKEVIDEMKNLSVIDNLTSTYNRTYFQHRLDDELRRSRRYKRAFSCVIIDIDNFKRINDEYGYITGDNVLKKFTRITLKNIRDTDVLCRYKGDQFIWLLPETELNDAYNAAERVRQFIITSDISDGELKINLTVSCGVSSFSDFSKEANELICQAEQALNKAKKDGANQTRVYEVKDGN